MPFIKFIIVFLFTTFAYGEDIKKSAIYQEINGFLRTIETLEGKGYEVSNKRHIPFKFILSVPGKIRLDYGSPPDFSIIVNQGIFTYYDVLRDQKTQLPTDTTFASIFSKAPLSLKDVTVISLKEKNNEYIVDLEKTLSSAEGRFRIFFSNAGTPLKIKKIEILNGKEVHEVVLTEIKINKKIEGINFTIPDKNFLY